MKHVRDRGRGLLTAKRSLTAVGPMESEGAMAILAEVSSLRLRLFGGFPFRRVVQWVAALEMTLDDDGSVERMS